MIRRQLHTALLQLPPEISHALAMSSLDVLARLPGGLGLLPQIPSGRSVQCMGITFPNGVGLAAGLDKNADHIDALGALGFGFIEVGTVTPLPQQGNPKPRLFRLPAHRALINRMGFNNKGLDHAVAKAARRHYSGVLGFNIGKNASTPVERAVDDYLIGLRKAHPVADYITINLSSPNTPNLRDLQYGEPLQRLLTELREASVQLDARAQRRVPLVVKIAPDMADEDLDHVASTLRTLDYAAVIATNTTLERSAVQGASHAEERGGLSGAPLRARATEVAAYLKQQLSGHLPVIGVGGIDSGNALKERLSAGADLIQIYTGFVYQGVDLVSELIDAWNTQEVART